MDYQQKIVLIVVALLLALAIYFVLTTETPVIEEPADTTEALELLIAGIESGKGQGDYVYAYTEISDGYKTEYTLTKKGNESMVNIKNQLSSKRIFFLENDSILCVQYSDEEVCSSVRDNKKVENYLESLSVKFFDDQRIERNVRDVEFLIASDYLILNPEITNKSNCREMSYALDYTEMSISDAARFGIGVTAPKNFDVKMCVEKGLLYEKSFEYSLDGMAHSYLFELVSFNKYPDDVVAPENLTDGAVNELEKEREQQVKLVKCFTTMEGNESNKCIATIALNIKRKELCELAGERRDRCLVSIVPLTKDVEICPTINNESFKDDCYIELAGAYKDSSYCDSVLDTEKNEFCLEISVPVEPSEINETEETSDQDILDFLTYVDQENSTSE